MGFILLWLVAVMIVACPSLTASTSALGILHPVLARQSKRTADRAFDQVSMAWK